jgi:hypothetical protein
MSRIVSGEKKSSFSEINIGEKPSPDATPAESLDLLPSHPARITDRTAMKTIAFLKLFPIPGTTFVYSLHGAINVGFYEPK